ncbi:kinase domain containing protein [Coccidioides posadasii C735 delta SOWgp]|uniref:non-specific serine/threonine protein kinase n=1 Tax=Coccidioides posadasii (strain C735) TaxID=222929 RepID=C5P928_COCP7|nr:kinase domain containing protein [Coccidioides posadasii C735 delta SOWgp]EER26240.1 kinase domain containing protein [Coccidioides posadasii C735 delta SOWgp]|eukprot:XP_003068385.1 kinase domain containing protein [Coccidioides posadasii C735 delta SOWgp]
MSTQKPEPSLSKRSSLYLEDSGLGQSKRLSIDTGSSEYDYLTRSPLLEPDHAPAPSGLPRIRQRPQSRAPSLPLTSASSGASALMTPAPSIASSAVSAFPPDTASPELEDLHRFPSESLHSFSFARQSEEMLHTRYNVLRRTIDFMRDRFGWAASNTGTANTQAKLSGNPEVQSMVDVVDMVARANLRDAGKGQYRFPGFLASPVTGPPAFHGENVFEKAFASESLQTIEDQGESIQESPQQTASREELLSVKETQTATLTRGLKSAPASRRVSLKRTYTDIGSASLQNKLMDALSAQPYSTMDLISPRSTTSFALGANAPAVHSHSNKWSPAAQAVFRTEAKPRWTILAANDLACLVFGITRREFRTLSILNLVQEERREWLESKLKSTSVYASTESPSTRTARPSGHSSRCLNLGNGVTAQLLSKPPARLTRSKNRNDTQSSHGSTRRTRSPNHTPSKSRGVLICGDVVPIQKRNGQTGSASLWVMEKKGGLIWVVEEIPEHVVHLRCNEKGQIVDVKGDVNNIWGRKAIEPGTPLLELLPHIPTISPDSESPDYSKSNELKYWTALTSSGASIPTTVTAIPDTHTLRISSFPHIAGMLVLSPETLNVISANPVFASSLFGHNSLEGVNITDLVPDFDQFLDALTEHDNILLVDGMVIPEHSFRRARALSILRNGKADAASLFLRPTGLPARHRDGAEIMVDVQMRVVKSQSTFRNQHAIIHEDRDSYQENEACFAITELVYALWITYSRQFHSTNGVELPPVNPLVPPPGSPPRQPPPRQMSPAVSPMLETPPKSSRPQVSLLAQQLSEAASQPLTDKPPQPVPEMKLSSLRVEPPKKRTISDYAILEDLGSGAYGQVKLARCKWNPPKKMVLKYVTKKRILVDTWTRDRRLGTVPLEIHVLDYLRRDDRKHPNIVEMEGFFEDDINYYIEMTPHGFPGMDLFDYVELRTHMDEAECRNIFSQVVSAVHHLHTKAFVVHRDIKDENVVLDGERQVKLIDFGSAAYIKNGPFDVFVGTIDYAAPEVLQGRSYRGKEQDVWALGILLYTIIYKENPFYNVNEIMDHPLRIPFLPFTDDCIDLIRGMLNRNVDERLTITQVMEHQWMNATTNNPGRG